MKSCANCRFGVVAVVANADPAMVPTSTTTCHAMPPVATTSGNGSVIWPVVSPNDWCGAYVSGDVFPVVAEAPAAN